MSLCKPCKSLSSGALFPIPFPSAVFYPIAFSGVRRHKLPVNPGQIAAERAVSHIQDGMTVGRNSSTAVRDPRPGPTRPVNFRRCIATIRELEEPGRPTVPVDARTTCFDITVDGAG